MVENNDPATLDVVDSPELIFGLVAPLGAPLKPVSNALEDTLSEHGYETKMIRLSRYLEESILSLETPPPCQNMKESERLDTLMTRGNELRKVRSDALALLAANEIMGYRSGESPKFLEKTAFILRQLKHPDEVAWLRKIHGSAFHLIGVYSSEDVRRERLRIDRGIQQEEATRLIERDSGEEADYGQQVRDTFHHADVFVEFSSNNADAADVMESQIERYIKLLFGAVNPIITPTRDEYGMFFAHAASLRSADLSRQVGAAIVDPNGEIVSVGCNEVPKYGGGQYWEDDENDARDFQLGFDANTNKKREILCEVISRLKQDWGELTTDERQKDLSIAEQLLDGTRLMALTEFGRITHAEMEAILAAGRKGISINGGELYTTTFPCHNCAKHIISSGLSRVVYIEPYPKSLAPDFHEDSLTLSSYEDRKVQCNPFIGIAPRLYPVLFSSRTPDGRQLRRKKADGTLREDSLGLRQDFYPVEHIQREAMAVQFLHEVLETIGEEGKG